MHGGHDRLRGGEHGQHRVVEEPHDLRGVAADVVAGVDFTDVDRLEFRFEQDPATNDAVDYALSGIESVNLQAVGGDGDSWGAVKNLYR